MWASSWTATQFIPAAEGGVIETADVSLVVPPGAMDRDAVLTLSFAPMEQASCDEGEPWSPYEETITFWPADARFSRSPYLDWHDSGLDAEQKMALGKKLVRAPDLARADDLLKDAVPDARTPSQRFDHYKHHIQSALRSPTVTEHSPDRPLTDRKELARFLEATVLAGATLTKLPLAEDPGQFAIRIRLNNVEPLMAWSVMRMLVARTGRFPLLTAASDLSLMYQCEESFEPCASEFADEEGEAVDDDGSIADSNHAQAIAAIAGIDIAECLAQGIADFEQRDGDEESRSKGTAHLDWHGPSRWGATLLLLPTPHSWETLAYHSWSGAENEGPAKAMAYLKRWKETHGAELVCNYGTMLQFAVQRRPANEEEALSLAIEQLSNGFGTVLNSGVTTRDHAQALMSLDRWFLRSDS